jgi:hypothetical protein
VRLEVGRGHSRRLDVLHEPRRCEQLQ